MRYVYSRRSVLCGLALLLSSLLFCHCKFRGKDSSEFSEPDTVEQALINRKNNLKKIEKNFLNVLFVNETPTEFCEVTFNVIKWHCKKRKHFFTNFTKANFGNRIRINDSFVKPVVEFPGVPSMYYTLIMLDPDAPNKKKPIHRSWLHWFVANIPFIYVADFSSGETLAEYVGPWPRTPSGQHRYVMLVYEHDEVIQFNQTYLNVTDFVERRNFSIFDFENTYSTGLPRFINYFIVMAHKSVYKVYKDFPVRLP